mmetsp:Transcript_27982/g.84375  ORF Transcript_27982/g.84375 Transcript_27982/m.84375 type:complete len:227 (+) Transcript_27982:119-799(+)
MAEDGHRFRCVGRADSCDGVPRHQREPISLVADDADPLGCRHSDKRALVLDLPGIVALEILWARRGSILAGAEGLRRVPVHPPLVAGGPRRASGGLHRRHANDADPPHARRHQIGARRKLAALLGDPGAAGHSWTGAGGRPALHPLLDGLPRQLGRDRLPRPGQLQESSSSCGNVAGIATCHPHDPRPQLDRGGVRRELRELHVLEPFVHLAVGVARREPLPSEQL